MTTADDRLLLADPPTGRISTTCDKAVHGSVDAMCYHYLTQQHYNNTVYRNNI
jgi:hypothetical protein